MDIVNLSEMPASWNWLSGSVSGPQPLRWSHSTTESVVAPTWLPKPASYRRFVAAQHAAAALRAPSSLLVSHGPRLTMYGALALASRSRARGHLAYSFNFTELPHGATRAAMRAAFRRVDRFVCFSTMERGLYADHFGLDIARFDMIHWAARAPVPGPDVDPSLPHDYLCAIGSQGRDYGTLIEAMRMLPQSCLVLVASPESLRDLAFPSNVIVRQNIPLPQAMGILARSRFSVVPLRDSEVPCGHVTLVAAMHCGKASVVSRSSGVVDYVHDGVDGLAVPARDAAALAQGIDRLWNDATLCTALGDSARAFAQMHCSEQGAIDYLERYLRRGAGLRAH